MEQPSPWQLSSDPRVAWIILCLVVPLGGWLLWEINRTIGLEAPHLWELLKNDRVFDLAMLDFFVTAGWALVVLFERSRVRGPGFWLSLVVFCVIPSIGIALFILVCSGRKISPSSDRSD